MASAPAIFQRTMDSLLQGIPHVAAYLDDILITGEDDQEHLRNLDAVLCRLETAGLRLKQSKCAFLTAEVVYLGHRINKEGLQPTSDKVRAVREFPTPGKVATLKSFLGKLSFYSKFLLNMSGTLAPLYALLQKNTPWSSGRSQRTAFQAAKEALLSNSLLVHFDSNKDITLACDASPYWIGAVLAHWMPDGSERPIAFASTTLTPAERNYAQIEREGLAIVFRFHSYLYGSKFTIYSDHQPLKYLFGNQKGIPLMAACRIQWWALTLSAYAYTMEYRPGSQLQNVDALSRLPLPQEVQTPILGEVLLLQEHLNTVSPITAEQISQWTERDPVLSRVLRWVRRGWPSQIKEDDLQPYARRRTELSVGRMHAMELQGSDTKTGSGSHSRQAAWRAPRNCADKNTGQKLCLVARDVGRAGVASKEPSPVSRDTECSTPSTNSHVGVAKGPLVSDSPRLCLSISRTHVFGARRCRIQVA